MKKLIQRIIWCLTGLIAILNLSGCNLISTDDEIPVVSTTISADGTVIAALFGAYSTNARLQIMRINKPNVWTNLPIPPRTTSIRFGLQGKELLITNDIEGSSDAVLSTLDVDNPQYGLKVLYKSAGLIYPVEVAPNEYLVRYCVVTSENKCHRSLGVGWDLIKQGKSTHRYIYRNITLSYSQPNVVAGQGFFWMNFDLREKPGQPFPQFLAFEFPEKKSTAFQFKWLYY